MTTVAVTALCRLGINTCNDIEDILLNHVYQWHSKLVKTCMRSSYKS
jgi:hypothetical protein